MDMSPLYLARGRHRVPRTPVPHHGPVLGPGLDSGGPGRSVRQQLRQPDAGRVGKAVAKIGEILVLSNKSDDFLYQCCLRFRSFYGVRTVKYITKPKTKNQAG